MKCGNGNESLDLVIKKVLLEKKGVVGLHGSVVGVLLLSPLCVAAGRLPAEGLSLNLQFPARCLPLCCSQEVAPRPRPQLPPTHPTGPLKEQRTKGR